MLSASLKQRIAKDPFKLHIRHILPSMKTTTTSVQKIWIFHCRGEGCGGRLLIVVFCVYDYRETSFSFTALWPIFGHCPLPLPNFQTTKCLKGGDVSSTPNLQPGGPHTVCRTETVWHLAQNLSSMVILPAATLLPAQLSKFTNARKFLYSAKHAFDKVGYIGTQGAIPQRTKMTVSVNYS